MNRWTRIATLALLCAALAPLSTRAQEKGTDKGWVSLFDGKTLDGWSVVEFPNNKTDWEVKDGAICGSGQASMLVTDKGGFKNIRFRAEIKINDNGNSGMYFRATEKPGFTDGYEAQINSSHADPIRTGSIYTMVHVYKQLVKPDTWFTQEIEVKDINYRGKMVTSIRVKVNDELLYEFLDHNQTYKGDHLAFQQHDPGSKVCIRKVEVMQLPSQ